MPALLTRFRSSSAVRCLHSSGAYVYGPASLSVWMVMEGLALSCQYGWTRYTSEQPPYNLLDRRIENE